MRIGLINIESNIYNTALMQISWHHKNAGDEVAWWSPLEDGQFDHVYCSSLFRFTDKSEVPARAICGGTGFDVNSRLSNVIEACDLDYSIYPDCDRTYYWFSRGCIRNCPWCVVRQKEGFLRPVRPKNMNPDGLCNVVCDNNFFANPKWKNAIDYLWLTGKPVDFQGIDVRTITDRQCEALAVLKHHKQIKIAWDRPKDEKLVIDGIVRLTKYVKCYKIMCYVLIGFSSTPEEDMYRIKMLKGLRIDSFVMPYDKSDLYQAMFSRWVNRKQVFKTITWEQYQMRKLGKIVFKLESDGETG